MTTAASSDRRRPPRPAEPVAGNLLDELPEQIESAGEHGLVVVFHSAVIAYLDPADRSTSAALMHQLVSDGRCRWISNEGPHALPDVPRTAPMPDDGTPTVVLGIDGRAVARTHGPAVLPVVAMTRGPLAATARGSPPRGTARTTPHG